MFKMMWACGFVLVLLLPQFPSTPVIRLDEFVDIDMENELFPRDPVEPCGEEDAVDLSNMRDCKILAHRIKSDKIRHVDLSFNRIENIPNSFFRDVPNIECLNLTSNEYSPRKVLNGTKSYSLKTLILDGFMDGVYYNPCEITGYFPNLESLYLNEIKSCFIDESFKKNVPKLTTLYMMNYGIIDKLDEFLLPATVRHLHLEGTIFEGFSNIDLRNLQSLYLNRYEDPNGIDIPHSAVNLQIFSCRQCSYDSDKINDFFRNPRDALKLFDLSHNSLSYLPESMSQQAKNLESLLLSNNQLTKMPDVQNLPQLRGLVLSHNRIDQVADIKSDSLKMLSLRANNIITINDSTFQKLPVLEALDLSENKLASMPDGWASGMKNLVSLNLKSNLFVSFSNMFLKSAANDRIHLRITGNPIEEVLVEDILLLPDNCTLHMMSNGGTANKTSNDD